MRKINDVFISYRRYENDAQKTKQGTIIAKEIYNYLTSKGLRVFLDEEKMDNGPFPEQLQWHVAHAPNYIFIATEAAMAFRPLTPPDRDYVEDEVRLALQLYEENSEDRVLLSILPCGVDIPADSNTCYPEEIHKLFKHQVVMLDDDIPSPQNMKDIHSLVTEVNRGNLWNAGYRWLEQAKLPGRRFAGLCIDRMILPQANAHVEGDLQMPINAHRKEMRDVPLMDAIRDTSGHLYLIGEGGIGKTTALMSIMEEVYGPNQSDGDIERNRLNGQIPLFVELSRAPDTYGRLYEGGRSTFIQRAIYQQIRQDLKVKQISSAAVEQIEEVFNLDPDTAVKPIHDLFSHQSPSPEYLLLLDGLNEVSRVQIRHETTVAGRSQLDVDAPVVSMVLKEIRQMMEDCPNVRVILTSRSEEQTTWGDRTTMLYLSGVELDVIDNYLRGRALPEARIVAAERNEKLREILRIPLFLTLYASLTGDDEILSRGEILHMFFHQKKEQLYTVRARNEAVHEDVDRAASARQINRITPDMQCFILDFILPEIAWRMVEDGEFYLQLRGRKGKKGLREIIWNVLHDESGTAVCGENGRDAFGAYRYGSTSRQNTRTIAQELCRRLSGDQADDRDAQEEIVGGILDYAVLTAGVLQNDGASNGRMANYGFIHHHIRDYFAAVYQINRLRMAVFLHDYDYTEMALDCLADWKARPLQAELRRFIGEALGEAHNAPTCDAEGNWHYVVPDDACDRNLIKRGFDIFRNRFDGEDGYCVWNLLQILKDVRQDLSGVDFSALDLKGCELNNIALAHKGLSASFEGARIDDAVFMPQGHTDEINSVFYSPDGKYILAAANDGTVKIWDAETCQTIGKMDSFETWVTFAVYRPDGKYILTVSDSIQIWDTKTLCEAAILKEKCGPYETAVYTADGKFIVSSYGDVWDAKTYQPISKYDWDGINITPDSCNPHDQSIVITTTAYMDFPNDVEVLDLQTGLRRHLTTDEEGMLSISSFSRDGQFIAVGRIRGNIEIWDAKSFKLLKTLPENRTAKLLRFNPDGRSMVAVYEDTIRSQKGILRIWDTNTWQEIITLQNEMGFDFASYSPDGRYLIVRSGDNMMRIYNTRDYQQVSLLNGYNWMEPCAVFHPNGEKIIQASSDNTVRIWEVDSFRLNDGFFAKTNRRERKHSTVICSPNGERILTLYKTSIIMWDAHNLQRITEMKGCHEVQSAVYSPDSKWIAASYANKDIIIWDGQTYQQKGSIHCTEFSLPSYVSFDHEGERLLIARQLWETKGFQKVGSLKDINPINTAFFSPDGRTIVTTSKSSDEIGLWDAPTLKKIRSFSAGEIVRYAAFTPDGQRIMTMNSRALRVIMFWNASTFKKEATLKIAMGNTPAFSSDGRYMLISALNRTEIWDIQIYQRVHIIESIPGLQVLGLDLRNLHPSSDLTDETKERLYEYGAIVDKRE